MQQTLKILLLPKKKFKKIEFWKQNVNPADSKGNISGCNVCVLNKEEQRIVPNYLVIYDSESLWPYDRINSIFLYKLFNSLISEAINESILGSGCTKIVCSMRWIITRVLFRFSKQKLNKGNYSKPQ